MLSTLRNKFIFLIDRTALCLHRAGLTPNMSTAIGFVFAALAGLMFLLRISDVLTYIVSPFFVLLSGLFDALDGSLARLSGQTTKFGGVLDSTFDRYGEVFVLSGITLGGLSSPFWGLAAISCSLMVSYVRARVEVEGVSMSGVGVAERAERILILVAASFLGWIEYGVILVAIFSAITVVQRVLYAYRHLD